MALCRYHIDWAAAKLRSVSFFGDDFPTWEHIYAINCVWNLFNPSSSSPRTPSVLRSRCCLLGRWSTTVRGNQRLVSHWAKANAESEGPLAHCRLRSFRVVSVPSRQFFSNEDNCLDSIILRRITLPLPPGTPSSSSDKQTRARWWVGLEQQLDRLIPFSVGCDLPFRWDLARLVSIGCDKFSVIQRWVLGL